MVAREPIGELVSETFLVRNRALEQPVLHPIPHIGAQIGLVLVRRLSAERDFGVVITINAGSRMFLLESHTIPRRKC